MAAKIIGIFFALLVCTCTHSKNSSTKSTTKTTTTSKSKSVNEIVQKAKAHLGTRYKSGGKSPDSGFDCSGFTCYIFNKMNIFLQPTASSQAEQGRPVYLGEAAPGDLIFFKGANANDKKIGHVGIIVSEIGQKILFIHASSSKGIMQSALDEKYFKDRFVKIRRVM